jgi:hypothetical protein
MMHAGDNSHYLALIRSVQFKREARGERKEARQRLHTTSRADMSKYTLTNAEIAAVFDRILLARVLPHTLTRGMAIAAQVFKRVSVGRDCTKGPPINGLTNVRSSKSEVGLTFLAARSLLVCESSWE